MRGVAILGAIGVSACSSTLTPTNPSARSEWTSDWAVHPGFSLTRDTEGYDFPTALAFIPAPGPNAKDPAYFVTELRGKVKVVTNDRTVYTFAENFFDLLPPEELPHRSGEVGLAGICLAPEQGFVFVTFAFQDQDQVLRNNIVRFETTPGTFAVEPGSRIAWSEIFAQDVSAPSHQIGPCQVTGRSLLVGIGDGEQPSQSQNPHSTLGKVLRMTLDGKPAPGNPFRQDDSVAKAANFVWASGLRNPFSLKVVGERLFVVDNGPDLDRFLEIQAGGNYLWNGTDWSAGTHALAALSPSVAPVQLDYYPAGASLFPARYQQTFFMASAGEMRHEDAKRPGVLGLHYSVEESRLLSVPEFFLSYRGRTHQMVTGLALGPDGLYVMPLFPDGEGRTALLRVTYDPSHEHPIVLGRSDPAVAIMRRKGCFGCHTLTNVAEGGSAGPRLDRDSLTPRLLARLHAPDYRRAVQRLDELSTDPFRGYRAARQEVLAAQGLDRVHLWLTYRIREPRFDDAFSQMPNLGVSEEEASSIARYLLSGEGDETEADGVPLWQRLPPPRHRYTAFAFLAGAVGAFVLSLWAHRRRRDTEE